MAGEIVHLELRSSDFARSAAFYEKVFGWHTDGVQSGGHLLFNLPGAVQGSWIRDALAQAAGPIPFVAVPDVDHALAEVEKQGGRILVRRMALANRGTFGLLADHDGNVIGVLSASAAAKGAPGRTEGVSAGSGDNGGPKRAGSKAAAPTPAAKAAKAPPGKAKAKAPAGRKR